MSTEINSEGLPKKRRRTSIPLLIVMILLGIGAYYAGPTVMIYAIYFQEQWARSEVYASQTAGGRGGPSVLPGSAGMTAAGPDVEAGSAEAGGPPPGGRGNFDPSAFFVTQDADGNGKLEGKEISERMQARMAEIDTDKDGALTKEEFMAGAPRGRGRARPEGDSAPSPEQPATPAIDVNNPPLLQAK